MIYGQIYVQKSFAQIYQEELDLLTRQLKFTEQVLNRSPEQTLRIRKKGSRYAFYCSRSSVSEALDATGCDVIVSRHSPREQYLRKKDPLLPRLILKYCAGHLRKLLREQIRILETSPESYDSGAGEQALRDLEDVFGNMMPEAFASNRTYLEKWAASPYDKSTLIIEGQKLYKTLKGDLVRSKLEMIVADILFTMKIPYRYEASVTLANGKRKYPDFTILSPVTRKIYYLEVCGKMADPGYVNDLLEKLHLYSEVGIIQGDNLLLVFENENIPFDPDDFRKMLAATVLKGKY